MSACPPASGAGFPRGFRAALSTLLLLAGAAGCGGSTVSPDFLAPSGSSPQVSTVTPASPSLGVAQRVTVDASGTATPRAVTVRSGASVLVDARGAVRPDQRVNASVEGAGVLLAPVAAGTGQWTVTAATPGSARLIVTVQPVCPATVSCPRHVLLLAAVPVTVR